jgi:choline dehydrogenase-like flavoprotein
MGVAHTEGDGRDWPFGLEELEPYYDKIEYELGVSGQAGTSRAKSTSAGTSLRGHARANTRCRRCAERTSPS